MATSENENENNGSMHIEDENARAGRETGRMRWVLGIGTLIAIIAMSIAWIVPALS